ncbi:RDD family protein [Ruminococcaceae bacterium YRB3002]|nr:RDD family protein [Ruminococcaceae bacterium YRB3002]
MPHEDIEDIRKNTVPAEQEPEQEEVHAATVEEIIEDTRKKRKKQLEETIKPTRRFFARVFDMVIIAAIFIPVIHFSDMREFTLVNYLIIQGLYTVSFFIYDALMTAFFGRTLGKMLLGLWVTNKDGMDIGFINAVVREAMLLVMGLGLLIPPVTVVMCILSFAKAVKNKPLIWEKNSKPFANKITVLRCIYSTLIVVVFIVICMLPITIDYFTLVPHTGDLTAQEFVEDYEAISRKYMKTLSEAGRGFDPAYYDANKLYDSDRFEYLMSADGKVDGFKYYSFVKYHSSYSPEERDLVVIGITTLVASIRDNRVTYNMIMEYFSKVFEEPFRSHDITGGGIRVHHDAEETVGGYRVTYTVTRLGTSADRAGAASE